MGTSISEFVLLQTAEHIQKLSANVEATMVILTELESTSGQNNMDFVESLPDAYKRFVSNIDIVSDGKLHPHLYEAMLALVQLVAMVLSKEVDGTLPDNLQTLSKVLEALSDVLDPSTLFYKFRGDSNKSEITVNSGKLDIVLQVPGFSVKVFGDIESQLHYFCRTKEVKYVGVGCDCCAQSPEVDAVLMNLTWQFVSACGFDHILRILSVPGRYSLHIIDLLLRPIVHLLEYNVGSKSWKMLMEFMESAFIRRMKCEFEKKCFEVCSELYRHLVEMWDPRRFSSASVDKSGINHRTIVCVLLHVHSIACWGMAYYGGSRDYISLKAKLCKLLETNVEQFLHLRRYAWSCTIVVEVVEASLVPSARAPLLSLDWVKEKKVFLQLLTARYIARDIPMVMDFVKILAKLKGYQILEEEVFINILKGAGSSFRASDLNLQGHYLIVAAMLESFDLSMYTSNFFAITLDWLEDFKVESAISSPQVFRVLSTLLIYDKERKWEKRFLNLLWKHSATIPTNELVDCLSRVLNHYTSNSEFESLKKAFLTSEEQSILLHDCNNADSATCVLGDVNCAIDHNSLYGPIAKKWDEKETQLHSLTSSNLRGMLEMGASNTRRSTASECIERLTLAQELTGGLSADGSNTTASAITSAMMPEFQTLDALQKESILYAGLGQHMQILNHNHICLYTSIRQELHERLVTFFESCRKEKEDVIREDLYWKAKVMVSMKRGLIGQGVKLSFADILSRMLQNAERTFQQVENLEVERMESVPNDECAVCMIKFSLKRKRACLDPCGHVNTCIQCATQEWKRSKLCPSCKTNIEKPLEIPHRLFF